MKAGGIFPVHGDYKVVQHIISNNIQGPKESKRYIVYGICNYGMGSDMHTIKEDN